MFNSLNNRGVGDLAEGVQDVVFGRERGGGGGAEVGGTEGKGPAQPSTWHLNTTQKPLTE